MFLNLLPLAAVQFLQTCLVPFPLLFVLTWKCPLSLTLPPSACPVHTQTHSVSLDSWNRFSVAQSKEPFHHLQRRTLNWKLHNLRKYLLSLTKIRLIQMAYSTFRSTFINSSLQWPKYTVQCLHSSWWKPFTCHTLCTAVFRSLELDSRCERALRFALTDHERSILNMHKGHCASRHALVQYSAWWWRWCSGNIGMKVLHVILEVRTNGQRKTKESTASSCSHTRQWGYHRPLSPSKLKKHTECWKFNVEDNMLCHPDIYGINPRLFAELSSIWLFS